MEVEVWGRDLVDLPPTGPEEPDTPPPTPLPLLLLLLPLSLWMVLVELVELGGALVEMGVAWGVELYQE